jgi:hypothetical protein
MDCIASFSNLVLYDSIVTYAPYSLFTCLILSLYVSYFIRVLFYPYTSLIIYESYYYSYRSLILQSFIKFEIYIESIFSNLPNKANNSRTYARHTQDTLANVQDTNNTQHTLIRLKHVFTHEDDTSVSRCRHGRVRPLLSEES